MDAPPPFDPIQPFSNINPTAIDIEKASHLLKAMTNEAIAYGLNSMADDVARHPSENQLIVLTLREAAFRLCIPTATPHVSTGGNDSG